MHAADFPIPRSRRSEADERLAALAALDYVVMGCVRPSERSIDLHRFLLLVIAISLWSIGIFPVRAAEPEPPDSNARVTVWSGVSYQDLKVGTGATVRPGQIVTCHTTGWLSDGTRFWSSRDDDGAPYDQKLRAGRGGIIAGMVDGLPGMKVGGLRKLWIPAELAYGKNGFGTSVPPDTDLVFEVEIFAIVKPKKKP
jgi:FKBP-type peptidyl-prolyl cis-trans isomerase FkpA